MTLSLATSQDREGSKLSKASRNTGKSHLLPLQRKHSSFGIFNARISKIYCFCCCGCCWCRRRCRCRCRCWCVVVVVSLLLLLLLSLLSLSLSLLLSLLVSLSFGIALHVPWPSAPRCFAIHPTTPRPPLIQRRHGLRAEWRVQRQGTQEQWWSGPWQTTSKGREQAISGQDISGSFNGLGVDFCCEILLGDHGFLWHYAMCECLCLCFMLNCNLIIMFIVVIIIIIIII